MTYANSNQNDSGKLKKFPEIMQQKGYAEKFNQEKNLKLPPIRQKSIENLAKVTEKRPVKLGYPSEALNPNSFRESPQQLEMHEKKEVTSLSQDSNKSKKIIKWHMWWDKSRSDVRVPSYSLPPKNVPSKIGSLEKINHKPGGGNVTLLDEKLKWNKAARIDHLAKGYVPGGGNRKILNEKIVWKTSSKIGSLENINHLPGGGNISIVDQPFNRNGIRPRIDSGFIYEEVYVPVDYVVKPTPRSPNLEIIHENFRKSSRLSFSKLSNF